jgi:hypothetical protein
LTPISATRADALFVTGIEATLDARAEFMTVADYLTTPFWRGFQGLAKGYKDNAPVQRCHYRRYTEECAFLAKVLSRWEKSGLLLPAPE